MNLTKNKKENLNVVCNLESCLSSRKPGNPVCYSEGLGTLIQSLCNAFLAKVAEVFFFVITEDNIIISVTLKLIKT